MNYIEPTQEEKEALHIADVSESFLTFNNSEGADINMEVYMDKQCQAAIETRGYGEMFLTKEQTEYMVKWILYSR